MKKLVRVISVLTLTLCMGLALTACAKEDGKYVGKMTANGMEMTVTTELKDGKFTTTITWEGQEEPMTINGTYKVDGNKFTATYDGGKITGTIKAGESMTYTIPSLGKVTLKYKK